MKDFYEILALFCESTEEEGMTFQRAKRVLDAVYAHCTDKIECCPNDCVSYWDPAHRKLSRSRNSHRTSCHLCGEDRWYVDKEGTNRPRKVLHKLRTLTPYYTVYYV